MKVIYSKRVVTAAGERAAYIHIKDGIITDISDDYTGEFLDFSDKVIMPGLVDTHVHVNEPGRTDWEGFSTATHAAAAGGITTVVDMPLNCLPVTTTKDALDIKIREIKDKLWVDVGFWGGVVPESVKDLPELLDAGVLGVKSFLIHSGIDEFPEMKRADLDKAMPIMTKYQVPYLIHAEMEDENAPEIKITNEYQTFLDSRPRELENNAIDLMIELTKKHKSRVHIVHLSSSDALEEIKAIKESGLPFTAETCPHYLTLNSEAIPDGKTIYKCCPPIREDENREALWGGLKSGVIDFIVSDHSPCTPNLKLMDEGDFDKAWGGISSLQFGLSLIWSEARARGFSVLDLCDLMSKKTSDFIGLGNKKGRIAIGHDADFVIWSPDEEFEITKDIIEHKHKETPYEGRKVFGKVYETILAGETIYKNGEFPGSPRGKIILRK